jgi:hypothetical protein
VPTRLLDLANEDRAQCLVRPSLVLRAHPNHPSPHPVPQKFRDGAGPLTIATDSECQGSHGVCARFGLCWTLSDSRSAVTLSASQPIFAQ